MFWKAVVSVAITVAGVFVAKELIETKSYFSASIAAVYGLYYAAEVMKDPPVVAANVN